MSNGKSNPYLTRRARNAMETGHRAEAGAVQALKGRATPASGALEGAKGDVLVGAVFRAEIKSTASSVLRLEYAAVRKIVAESAGTGDKPSLVLQFVDERGVTRVDGRWVAVPANVFMEMLESYEPD